MFLRLISIRKAIAGFLALSLFVMFFSSLIDSKNLIADVCFEIDIGSAPIESRLVGDDLYVFASDVVVINTQTGEKETISVGASGTNYGTLVNTDLYVMGGGANQVFVLDTLTNTITDTIDVNTTPRFSTLVNGNLYVSNWASDNVSVIDTSTNTVIETITVGNGPFKSFSFNDYLYVLDEQGDSISVIDTNANVVDETIVGFTQPRTFVILGSDLYVSNNLINTVSVVDLNTNTITDTITVGQNSNIPVLVGTDIYIGNVSSASISVIDTNTNTVTDTINTVSAPYYLSVVGNYVYVSDYIGNSVFVVDTNTNTIVDTIAVGTEPEHTVLVGTDLYVFNYTSQDISVIDTLTNEVKDSCGPILLSSEIEGDTIILTYDETLDPGSIPGADSFVVEIDGQPAEISSVGIVDETVVITILLPAQYSEVVLLSYEIPIIGAIQDLGKNKAPAFDNEPTINNTASCGIIEVGSVPYSAIKVGSNLYVNNVGSTYISVVNTGTNLEVDTIDINASVFYSTAVGDLVYAYDALNIYVIDTTTNTLDETLSLSGYIYGTLVDDHIYLNSADLNEIHTLDITTNTIDDTITVGTYPYSSVLYGTDLYVFNQSSDNVSVIDTTTNTVTDTISVGAGPTSGVVIDNYVYVNNYTDSTISVIDISTNTVIDTFATSSGVQFSLYDENGFLYLTQDGTNSVAVIDVSDNSVVGNVNLGDGALPYFLTDSAYLIYVSDAGQDQMFVIDKDTQELYACPVNFTLIYSAGSGGSISGTSPQVVESGEDGSPVTAVPNSGYEFTGWSDAVNDNPRTDLNVSGNIAVTANFALSSVGSSSGSGSTGTTVYGRFRNFITMGKFEEAYKLIEQYPEMFTSENHSEYNFCDNALFTNFMQKKDVDGRYSAYYKDTVTEVSKLQSFVNKLFVYQYLQASGPIDGIFGPLTKIGVERLQNLLNVSMDLEEDLDIDGIVGPYTRSAVNDFCLPENF
jgi:YVTN family beta-propeller protein